MASSTRALEGGFENPVMDSQVVFRAIMEAMSMPGTIVSCSAVVQPPPPLQPALGAVVCALCDHDTAVWLDPFLKDGAAVEGWLAFQTGAPVVEEPEDCTFALVGDPTSMPSLDRFAQGSQEYPDRSSTLVLQVPTLTGGQQLSLAGPGIAEKASIAPRGLPGNFLEQWASNRARFPRGVDVVLAAGDTVACLPRTVRITLAEN
ncbi:phosphonate C-P lyase system protein PhnH [Oricola sp.]|uniref:phosphonate C-P lyase system protein PhnH n=1 Tax=Oricola sp. TaxID=1979950 RepID=UPI003BA9AE84